MDFASLQIFRAVVDEGGIIPAARKLHRVQSNVTTRIKQLETSLGVALFIREKRRLQLSPAGEIFLEYTDRLLELSQQARHAVISDTPRGVLRLGTLESTAATRLPPLLSRYHARYPEVRVELATHTTDALIEAVLARRFDAALVAGCDEAQALGLAVSAAFAEELVIAAPQSHPPITCAHDVLSDTLISFPSGCAYRRRLQSWLAGGGISAHKVLELSSYHAIAACVAAGTGIALIPRSVLDTIKVADNIALYPPGPEPMWLTTYLVWQKNDVPAPALTALQAEICALQNTRQRPDHSSG
jgi:DNA-binding transcriptional LysR family regulator